MIRSRIPCRLPSGKVWNWPPFVYKYSCWDVKRIHWLFLLLFMWLQVQVCMCACRVQRTTLCVIPKDTIIYILFDSLFWDRFLLHSLGCSGTQYVGYASFKLPDICPLLPPKSWDWSSVPPHLVILQGWGKGGVLAMKFARYAFLLVCVWRWFSG